MLYDIETGKQITKCPYPRDMERITDTIPADRLQEIYVALDKMIDGTEIQTSSWMPGNDWTNTPFDPIFSLAARCNYDIAARMFGLIVWDVFMKREEKWFSGHFELNGEPIKGRTYFRPRT